MKVKALLPLFALVISMSGFGAEVAHNEKLGDAMGLLSDVGSLVNEFSKKAPKALEAKEFNRQALRARGGVYLLKVIAEKKGSISETGELVPNELTPGKFVGLKGEELEASLAKYDELLGGVVAALNKIEAELKSQGAKAPEERDFRELKLGLAALNSAINKAHQEFKPPQTP